MRGHADGPVFKIVVALDEAVAFLDEARASHARVAIRIDKINAALDEDVAQIPAARGEREDEEEQESEDI